MLGTSFTAFVEHCLKEVKRHKDMFPAPSKTNTLRFEALIKWEFFILIEEYL